MALQDLTPQLRTRLSRVERLVGLFVAAAALLLGLGLCYYVLQTAKRKGWFLVKVPYFTFVRNATGLKVGDKVKLMGFDVGEIVEITAQPPEDPYYNVYVRFMVREPFYGYLWDDSKARVAAGDFLGNRSIEVTKGTNGAPTYLFHELEVVSLAQAESLIGTNQVEFGQVVREAQATNLLARPGAALTREALASIAALGTDTVQVVYKNKPSRRPTGFWDEKAGAYRLLPRHYKGFFLLPDESPALTERLEQIVNTVEAALPDFLLLTNKLAVVLSNAASITRHADDLLIDARPVLTNVAQITANLNGPKGALGDWLIPTNLNAQLETTLGLAGATLLTAQTNLAALSSQLLLSLDHLAGITSNLNAQVQANGSLLGGIADLIQHTDDAVQGLKRHWLLKSAFRAETNATPRSIVKPRMRDPP